MKFELAKKDNLLIVRVSGELDHHFADEIRLRVDAELVKPPILNILFDFNDLTFMDSSGIGMILGRYRKMGEKPGNMAIVCCSKPVRSIMNMAGVFSIIDYFDTREEALLFLEERKFRK